MDTTPSELRIVRNIQDLEVKQWISAIKLTFKEVCWLYSIDIDNDHRNAFFLNLTLNNRLVIDEDLLSWCGYSGPYETMKHHFFSLLKKNPHMEYTEINVPDYHPKSYIVMESLDFESLLMQMHSRKAHKVRKLYSLLKYLVTQYVKYEKYYEEYRKELISCQNYQLTQSVCELRNLVLEERMRAEEEHTRAEDERTLAEAERQRAEARQEQAEEERREAVKRHNEVFSKPDVLKKRIRTEVVHKLPKEIAALVAQPPISPQKDCCLGLLNFQPGREWYIVRRQRKTFNKTVVGLLKRATTPEARLVKQWQGVAHSINIVYAVKVRLRQIKWRSRGNLLKFDGPDSEAYSDEDLVSAIEVVLAENAAKQLSDATETMVKRGINNNE